MILNQDGALLFGLFREEFVDGVSLAPAGFGTASAFLTAGALGLVSVAVASFTALRDYDVRVPEDIVAAEEDVEMEPAAAD